MFVSQGKCVNTKFHCLYTQIKNTSDVLVWIVSALTLSLLRSPAMEATATRFSSFHHFHPHNFQPKPNTILPKTRISIFTRNSPSPHSRISVNFSDRLRTNYTPHVQTPILSELVPETHGGDGEAIVASPGTLELKPRMFKNRFLNFVRFGSVINGAAETFFKSEIRRRLFVTAVLIVISRVGYFIPLPGFDRRLIPKDYMSFVSGSSVGKLHTLFPFF